MPAPHCPRGDLDLTTETLRCRRKEEERGRWIAGQKGTEGIVALKASPRILKTERFIDHRRVTAQQAKFNPFAHPNPLAHLGWREKEILRRQTQLVDRLATLVAALEFIVDRANLPFDLRRFIDDKNHAAKIVEGALGEGPGQWQQILPPGKLFSLIGQHGPVTQGAVVTIVIPMLPRRRGPLAQRRPPDPLITHRSNKRLRQFSCRALGVRIKLADRVDLVTKEFEPNRPRLPPAAPARGRRAGARGEDVQDATAQRELTHAAHRIAPHITDRDEVIDQVAQ